MMYMALYLLYSVILVTLAQTVVKWVMAWQKRRKNGKVLLEARAVSKGNAIGEDSHNTTEEVHTEEDKTSTFTNVNAIVGDVNRQIPS